MAPRSTRALARVLYWKTKAFDIWGLFIHSACPGGRVLARALARAGGRRPTPDNPTAADGRGSAQHRELEAALIRQLRELRLEGGFFSAWLRRPARPVAISRLGTYSAHS